MLFSLPGTFKKRLARMWDPDQWRYFNRFFDRKMSLVLLIVLGALISGIMVFPITAIIRYIVDQALPSAAFRGLLYASIALFLLRFAGSSLMLGIRSLTARAISRSMGRVRAHISDLLLYKLSREEYTHIDLVRIHTKVIEDTSRLDRLFNALLARLLPSLVAGAVLCLILIYLSGLLFLILLGLVPLMLLVTRTLGAKVRRRVRVFQEMFELYSKRMLFVLQHLDLVRVHASEDRESHRSASVIQKLSDQSYRMTMSYALHSYAQNTLLNIYAILFIMAGGALVAYDRLSLGGFISFFVVANLLNGYLGRVIDVWPDIIAGRESARKLYELSHGIHRLPYNGSRVVAFDGVVEFQQVSFRFLLDHPPLLENINLKLVPGKMVGLTGPNGCGKTTITSLLMGFYRPEPGTITASSVRYDEIDFRALRPQIGIVMQNPILFQGTIRENIGYGQHDPSIDEIKQCARIALADEFIEKLPNGYDTDIGDAGVCLSGGQRQRLAITRALCSRPRLLIFDEITNHLDYPAMEQLLINLGNISPRPAILMIGHKAEEMKLCDVVYEIRDRTLHERNIKTPACS